MSEESIHYETLPDGTVRKINLITGEVIASTPTLESCLLGGQQIDGRLQKGKENLRYVYSPIWKDVIIDHFANDPCPTFTAFFRKPGMPSNAVLAKWRAQHPDLDEAISEAKKIRAERAADVIAEEVFSNKPVDKDSLPGVKLKLDNAKYLAKTGDPDSYGDKTQVKGDFQASVTYVIDTGIKRIEEQPIEADYQEITNGTRESYGEWSPSDSGLGEAREVSEGRERTSDSESRPEAMRGEGEGAGEAQQDAEGGE